MLFSLKGKPLLEKGRRELTQPCRLCGKIRISKVVCQVQSLYKKNGLLCNPF